MCHLFKKFLSLFYELKKKAESRKKYKTKHIARLSPVYPDDYNNNEYSVYSDYLKKAFSDSNIRNLAITGNYGIGKSSFIKMWSNKKKYLFVSLCSFSGKSSKNLECDLLQQLLLGCGYVAKNNNLIEQRWSIMKKIIVFISCFSVSATIYFLLFFDFFKPFFDILKPFFLNALEPIFSVFKISPPLQIVDKIKGVVYGFFSISMLIGLSGIIFKIIRYYKLTKIAFKLENAEIETECKDTLQISYMDRYRLDLIYALRKAASKLDYTIIFEDMDRLSLDDCRSLFTELREINRLINLHTSTKKPKKTLRFIYIIHDAVFCDDDNSAKDQEQSAHNQDQLMHLKFFDYIIPIVPSMIDKSSSNYITRCFNEIGFCHSGFINKIAIHLSDYRLIKNITNEYVILKDVYLTRNASNSFQSNDELHLMALVIYKVLLPYDYKKIREKTSTIFHLHTNPVGSNAVQCLLDNNWLSDECLKFVGYDLYEIKQYTEKFFGPNVCMNQDNNQIRQEALLKNFSLCSEIIINKLNNNENITECLSSVRYTLLKMVLETNTDSLFFNLLEKIPNSDPNHLESYNNEHHLMLCQFMVTSLDNDETSLKKLSIILNYLSKINHEDYNWFFEGVTELNELRCRIICNFDESALANFVQRANDSLVNWLNEINNSGGLPSYWDKYCKKDTAKILLELNLTTPVKNFFNSKK